MFLVPWKMCGPCFAFWCSDLHSDLNDPVVSCFFPNLTVWWPLSFIMIWKSYIILKWWPKWKQPMWCVWEVLCFQILIWVNLKSFLHQKDHLMFTCLCWAFQSRSFEFWCSKRTHVVQMTKMMALFFVCPIKPWECEPSGHIHLSFCLCFFLALCMSGFFMAIYTN